MPSCGERARSCIDRELLRELPNAWRVAYFFFGIAYMLILGTSLMINPVTISTFLDSVGVDQQPLAQTYLPLVLLPVLFIYNFLWAALQSPQGLVLVVCGVYTVLYVLIAVQSWEHEHLPNRWAWTLFYATNTKSVLFPVMLWSVMNDLSSTKYSTLGFKEGQGHLELHLELRYSVTQFAAQGCRPVGRTVGFVAKEGTLVIANPDCSKFNSAMSGSVDVRITADNAMEIHAMLLNKQRELQS
eukprot:g13561.t1